MTVGGGGHLYLTPNKARTRKGGRVTPYCNTQRRGEKAEAEEKEGLGLVSLAVMTQSGGREERRGGRVSGGRKEVVK